MIHDVTPECVAVRAGEKQMIRGLYVLITEYTVSSKLNLHERFERDLARDVIAVSLTNEKRSGRDCMRSRLDRRHHFVTNQ